MELELWQHQKDAIDFVTGHIERRTGRGGLLAHGMGTGKTRSAITAMTRNTERKYGRYLPRPHQAGESSGSG